MRKIAATYIFPGNLPPIKNGILVCSNNGTIIDLIDTKGNLREQAGIEYYSGVLVPGFINAHCHLELSYLIGEIPEKTGLRRFLNHIRRLRDAEPISITEAIRKYDFLMQMSGIVAVGDISNTTLTLSTKKESNIYYHTFAESFGMDSTHTNEVYFKTQQVEAEFLKAGLNVSITPHASYSVSGELLSIISENARTKKSILSVHHLESKEESMLTTNNHRPMQLLQGTDLDNNQDSRAEKIYSILPEENKLLLVHNTILTTRDLMILRKYRSLDNTFFVLCTNSNLHIENVLPPVPTLLSEKVNICIGTDSLASNHRLSVLEEMKTLQLKFPEVTLQQLIEWACINGADALGISSKMGSFEKGKNPGINLLTGIDLQRLKLTSSTKVKVIQKAIK